MSPPPGPVDHDPAAPGSSLEVGRPPRRWTCVRGHPRDALWSDGTAWRWSCRVCAVAGVARWRRRHPEWVRAAGRRRGRRVAARRRLPPGATRRPANRRGRLVAHLHAVAPGPGRDVGRAAALLAVLLPPHGP